MSMHYIKAGNTQHSQAITDVIESVALEGGAISHILDAEGEELEKYASFPRLGSEDIIAVNSSVCELIKQITSFEHELNYRLELIDNCPCECCDDNRGETYDISAE